MGGWVTAGNYAIYGVFNNFEADPGLATLTGTQKQWPAQTVLCGLTFMVSKSINERIH